ncbi:helicase associated domain-containing protein [Arthrobacter sp. NPDC055585]
MTSTTFTDPAETETWTAQHWSRHEWFYMWTKGLDPRRIAIVCRVPYRKVYDHIRSTVLQNPALFGQRLMVHDRPALPRSGLKNRRSWDQRCTELAEFRLQHGRLPRSYIEGESSLYSFLQYQRRLHRTRQLSASRKAALDKDIPGWLTPPKTDRERALWALRGSWGIEFVSLKTGGPVALLG